MSDWKECKLGDVAYLVKDTYKPKIGDHLPYIGLEHIQEQGLRLLGVGDSDSVTSQKFHFKPNDVLFGKLRPYFRKVVKPCFAGICSTDIWVVRALEGNDQNFIFYFFANQEFVDTANSGDSGTRMPRADWHFVKDTIWPFPSLPEQRAIAGVLSSLNDKIDLLHQQNKTLEGIAEAFWRKMFVEEADPGWDEVSLLELIDLVGGGTPKTEVAEYWDGTIHWLSAKDITANHKGFIIKTEKTITEIGLNNSSAKLLPSYSTVISARGTVGNYCMLSTPMAFSQSNYGILPRIGGCYYFTYLLVAHIVDELRMAAYGSVFDTITTNTFREHRVQVPSKDQIILFENEIRPYFDKIYINTIQISTLSRMRDKLLPKLMSGEVRVRL